MCLHPTCICYFHFTKKENDILWHEDSKPEFWGYCGAWEMPWCPAPGGGIPCAAEKKDPAHWGIPESVSTVIDHLAHHAHIDLPKQNINREAIRAFVDGVRDREIRCHLLVAHKKSFSESFPSGPLWFDFPNNILWTVKLIKLLIMKLRWTGKELLK